MVLKLLILLVIMRLFLLRIKLASNGKFGKRLFLGMYGVLS